MAENQPKDLRLKITLNKAEFAQGEKIEATLEYVCDLPTPAYGLDVGTEGPGGIFCAEDPTGHLVSNPREWASQAAPNIITGPSMVHPLGTFSITLRVNQDVRFDHPGTYMLFAGASVSKTKASPETTWIVSNKIPLTIVPLTPDREKRIITDALNKIGSSRSLNPQVREGFNDLNDLQTPAAREAELPFLSQSQLAWMAGLGFLGAQDPAAETTRILAAVRSGELILGREGILIYSMAKASSADFPHSTAGLSEKELRDRFQLVAAAEERAQKEIVDAMVTASGQNGPHQVQVLWTAFTLIEPHGYLREPDPDGGTARRALAKHQLELSKDEIQELFSNWAWWGSADFLPLVQREATTAPVALKILTDLSSEEAKAHSPVSK